MMPVPETTPSSIHPPCKEEENKDNTKDAIYYNAYSEALKVLKQPSTNATMATSALCSTSKAFFESTCAAMEEEEETKEEDDGQLFDLFRRPTDWSTSTSNSSSSKSHHRRGPVESSTTTVSRGSLDPPLTGHGSSRVLSMAVVRLEQEDSSNNNNNSNSNSSSVEEREDECDTISALTEIVLGQGGESIEEAHELFLELGRSIPRRVCQHPFRKNDIVWVCRTCQSDETCVLCHACYTHSNHEGHDVAFYHAQAGGCCDCGDPDAWDPAGFCHLHGGNTQNSALSPDLVQRVGGAVQAVAEFLVEELVTNVTNGFQRVSATATGTHHHPKPLLTRNPSMPDPNHNNNNINNNATNEPDYRRSHTAEDHHDMDMDTNHNNNNNSEMAYEEVASAGQDEELTFRPEAASTSKSRHKKRPSSGSESSDNSNNSDSSSSPVFDPEAAGKSRSRKHDVPAASPAQLLGQLGSEQDGLYIVLHADDIHLPADITIALKDLYTSKQQHGLHPSYNPHTEAILNKIARLLKQRGNLIVWGTHECISELGPSVAKCWKDGDRLACTRIGAYILDKARSLHRNYNLVVSIQTRHELLMEKRAQCVLTWLNVISQSCDPLCNQVSVAIHDEHKYLIPLLRADLKLPRHVTQVWHGLLLTLLAVPSFKAHLANAYADTYRQVTAEYARGLGILDKSLYTLSVQFLNRVTYVQDLVKERNLLDILSASLLETLRVAIVKDDRHPQLSPSKHPSDPHYYNPWDDFLNLYVPTQDTPPARRRYPLTSNKHSLSLVPTLNPMHPVLSHRRYSPCISDLKCVLNVQGMARLFASTSPTSSTSCLDGWIQSLSLGQFMDPQVWRSWSEDHVETEPRGWVGAFNASISLGSLFERLLSWEDDDPFPIDNIQGSAIEHHVLLSAVDVTHHVLTTGLVHWQTSEMLSYCSTQNSPLISPHSRSPSSLPMSTCAAKYGTHLATQALPIPQICVWSFHLPLHRFLASCLREVARRPNHTGGMEDLFSKLTQWEFWNRKGNLLFRGLMEFPLLVLSRSAQIRSGLWKRNGPSMQDQVLNYAEPPFCRALRDADLLLLQFSVLGHGYLSPDYSEMGCAKLVHLLLHRFGIFEFVGFAKAPNADVTLYREEIQQGYYPPEKSGKNDPDDSLVLPWTYSPAKDSTLSSLSLLEEVLHLLIILITELPPPPPESREDYTRQAKQRLRREVVHRLASGPRTHSELAEVHHVLPQRDNVILSEEGKLVNPDDATGAALEVALSEVAERKSSRQLKPDHWELKEWAWSEYDPAFFHISLRCHQSAAEKRPAANSSNIRPVAFAPPPPDCHSSFARLRKDFTSDSSVRALTYRTLHVHCRKVVLSKHTKNLRGKNAYENEAMSETVLARALHLLTLGAYAWQDELQLQTPMSVPSSNNQDWKWRGGGEKGSIFYHFERSPTAKDWVDQTLLAAPCDIMDSQWYEGEENCLLLLNRLACDGGFTGAFTAQDKSIRGGAAWLCEFASKHNSMAASLLGKGHSTQDHQKVESDLQKRRREAKERAMQRMKAEADKFAAQIDDMDDSNNDGTGNGHAHNSGTEVEDSKSAQTSCTPSDPSNATPKSNMAKQLERSMSIDTCSEHSDDSTKSPQFPRPVSRLFVDRPKCIICSDDGPGFTAPVASSSSSCKKTEGQKGDSVLALCGYAQASTVLKCGGGVPTTHRKDPLFAIQKLVGTHVTLCGHAMHSSCYESYMKTVAQRDDRNSDRLDGGKKGEFKCPLCQRLSNCLVPFIDIGVDWIDSPTQTPSSTPMDMDDDDDTGMKPSKSMDIEECADSTPLALEPLGEFLTSTPWWASRNNKHIAWDGRCTFIPLVDTCSIHGGKDNHDNNNNNNNNNNNTSYPFGKLSIRKSVRSFGKKDLYMAWNTVMRTPRFVRKHSSRGSQSPPKISTRSQSTSVDGGSSPVTDVWRRLLDQLSFVSFSADSKRLGEDKLLLDYGEFRHYMVEKAAYNTANRTAGKESTDWPACLSPTTISDRRKQELSREKLISKLFQSIYAFTYSCCSETTELKRVFLKKVAPLEDELQNMFAQYGVNSVILDGGFVLMPDPSATHEGGYQPFQGRIGKLRYLALSIMVATSAICREVVQLCLEFPVEQNNTMDLESNSHFTPLEQQFYDQEFEARAPVVFPLLCGHVLTHVTAAMFSTCGQARAQSDLFEMKNNNTNGNASSHDSEDERIRLRNLSRKVHADCHHFIQLGFLARLLQFILGCMKMESEHILKHISPNHWEYVLLKVVDHLLTNDRDFRASSSTWEVDCCKLIQAALASYYESNEMDDCMGSVSQQSLTSLKSFFLRTCTWAKEVLYSYLADIGLIYQVLAPGAVHSYNSYKNTKLKHPTKRLEAMMTLMNMEELGSMLQSPSVTKILKNWYEQSRSYFIQPKTVKGLENGQNYRAIDWPLSTSTEYAQHFVKYYRPSTIVSTPICYSTGSVASSGFDVSNPEIALDKTVPLLGGHFPDLKSHESRRPHIDALPTSYTDLYAKLGSLCPDSEQTALCLICGEVLNASGKGECTKHAYRCGGGSGIFFLLQECIGLIMHGVKAAYVHSPYVDSHGETPHYRGRPLNLDLDRYNILNELWSGHLVRQKVIAERGNSRQVIIGNFY